jgi:hypothetical protein
VDIFGSGGYLFVLVGVVVRLEARAEAIQARREVHAEVGLDWTGVVS